MNSLKHRMNQDKSPSRLGDCPAPVHNPTIDNLFNLVYIAIISSEPSSLQRSSDEFHFVGRAI
jgi:hypothetical protein